MQADVPVVEEGLFYPCVTTIIALPYISFKSLAQVFARFNHGHTPFFAWLHSWYAYNLRSIQRPYDFKPK